MVPRTVMALCDKMYKARCHSTIFKVMLTSAIFSKTISNDDNDPGSAARINIVLDDFNGRKVYALYELNVKRG